jgi:uncharacterized protein
MPGHDPLTWVLLGLAAMLVGMAKTGVPGLGILVVPLFFHAVPDGRLAPAVLLPLLVAADVAGVALFRRHAEPGHLWRLFPWVALGMAGGMVALATLPSPTLRLVVGLVVLTMAGLQLVRTRWSESTIPRNWRTALAFGLVAGFATTVANAAGPVMNLYLLGMGLPKDQFMGTGSWFFLIINLIKVPLYASQGMFTAHGLMTDLVLLPGVALGAWTGRRIYEHLPQTWFARVAMALVIGSGLLLVLRA